MLSPADLLIIGAAALLFFGPDQLPKVARQAGRVVRDVQATSQSFVREMERAADETEAKHRRDEVVPWRPTEVERVTEPPRGVAPDHLMEDGGVENPVHAEPDHTEVRNVMAPIVPPNSARSASHSDEPEERAPRG